MTTYVGGGTAVFAKAYEQAAVRAMINAAETLEFANAEEFNGYPNVARQLRRQALEASRQATINFKWVRFYQGLANVAPME